MDTKDNHSWRDGTFWDKLTDAMNRYVENTRPGLTISACTKLVNKNLKMITTRIEDNKDIDASFPDEIMELVKSIRIVKQMNDTAAEDRHLYKAVPFRTTIQMILEAIEWQLLADARQETGANEVDSEITDADLDDIVKRQRDSIVKSTNYDELEKGIYHPIVDILAEALKQAKIDERKYQSLMEQTQMMARTFHQPSMYTYQPFQSPPDGTPMFDQFGRQAKQGDLRSNIGMYGIQTHADDSYTEAAALWTELRQCLIFDTRQLHPQEDLNLILRRVDNIILGVEDFIKSGDFKSMAKIYSAQAWRIIQYFREQRVLNDILSLPKDKQDSTERSRVENNLRRVERWIRESRADHSSTQPIPVQYLPQGMYPRMPLSMSGVFQSQVGGSNTPMFDSFGRPIVQGIPQPNIGMYDTPNQIPMGFPHNYPTIPGGKRFPVETTAWHVVYNYATDPSPDHVKLQQLSEAHRKLVNTIVYTPLECLTVTTSSDKKLTDVPEKPECPDTIPSMFTALDTRALSAIKRLIRDNTSDQTLGMVTRELLK